MYINKTKSNHFSREFFSAGLEFKPAMRKHFLLILLLLRTSSSEMQKKECASACLCTKGVDFQTNTLDLTVDCHGAGLTEIPPDLPPTTTILILSNFCTFLYHYISICIKNSSELEVGPKKEEQL